MGYPTPTVGYPMTIWRPPTWDTEWFLMDTPTVGYRAGSDYFSSLNCEAKLSVHDACEVPLNEFG